MKMKMIYVLILMILALPVSACTADAGQETSVPRAQETAAIQETAPATAEAQADEAGPTPAEPPTPLPPPTGSAPTEEPAAFVLPVLAPAPAWNNDVWINAETALPLEDLRGKVVLLEFWTFG